MALLIRMNETFYRELIAYSRSKLPEEACGFITGAGSETELIAVSLVPLTNISIHPRQHFMMNPMEVVKIVQDTTLFKQIIGIFHTHPTSWAEPSFDDLETQWHTVPTHWIVSFRNKESPELQIFQIKKAPRPRLANFRL